MNPQEAKKLENKVLTILKTHISKNDCLVLGISGGPDSIFLYHFANQLGSKIVVAHINHLLRAKESDKDELFVKNLVKKSNNIFETLHSNIKAISRKSKQGLEETGRKIRYEFFQELAKKYQARFILTAHHADDNLETIIMNFVRGASLKGLCGMKESEPISKNLNLLRPLLQFPKSQIIDYLKTKKISFRLDKSNQDLAYRRNFIRHKIVPELKKINPNLAETLAKNTKNFRELSSFVETSASTWIDQNSTDKSFSKFNAKSFRQQPIPLQKEIILQLYKHHIGNTTNIESRNITEVLAILNSGLGNKKKKLQKLTFGVRNNIIQLEKIGK